MKKSLFISYSHADTHFVEQLYRELQDEYEIWYDRELKTEIGRQWWNKILTAIRDADICIFLLSPEAVNSIYCGGELNEAVRLQKPIIPIIVRQNTKLPPRIADLQFHSMITGVKEEDIRTLKIALAKIDVAAPRPEPLWLGNTPLPKSRIEKTAEFVADYQLAIAAALVVIVGAIIGLLTGVINLGGTAANVPTDTVQQTPELTSTTSQADAGLQLTSLEVTTFKVYDEAGAFLGDGEVRVFGPQEMEVSETSEIRLELQLNSPVPELSETLYPEPSATPVLRLTQEAAAGTSIATWPPTQTALPLVDIQFITLREFMGAEIVGLDADKFEISTVPPDGLRRIRPEAVNWWKWNIRPSSSAVGTNQLELHVYIPLRRDDGTEFREETNIIPLNIEVTKSSGGLGGTASGEVSFGPLIWVLLIVAVIFVGLFFTINRKQRT